MFGRGRFLDASVEDWHIECWAWLIRNGVDDGLDGFRKTDLVVPTQAFFPPTNEIGHAKAQFVFNTVQALAGMKDWPVRLVAQGALPAALSEKAFVIHANNPCAGTFRYDEDHGIITYDPTLLKRPIGLIATFAHELGHYLNASFKEPPPDGWDLVEPATDTTATFMGFGLFGANNSCADYQEFSEEGIPQIRRGKSGYLTEAQWIFDLAIFCVLTRTPFETAKPHLKGHLWKQLQRAGKYVEKRDIASVVIDNI